MYLGKLGRGGGWGGGSVQYKQEASEGRKGLWCEECSQARTKGKEK